MLQHSSMCQHMELCKLSLLRFRGVFGRQLRQLVFWVQVFPGTPLSAHVDRSSKSLKEAAAQGNIAQVRPQVAVEIIRCKNRGSLYIIRYSNLRAIHLAWLV